MGQIRYMELEQKSLYDCIQRTGFTCLKLSIRRNSDWLRRTRLYADEIVNNLNLGQANTSEQRTSDIVKIDNLSGIIAEKACEKILRWQYGEDIVIETTSESAVGQIDIKLNTGRTIEVRSSCVRNGIEFAVYAKDKHNPGQQYFDVIGPYSNKYKPGECLKDYYMRVLYWCNKKDFMSLLSKNVLNLYIMGGATKKMMNDPNIYQIKHLIPSGGQVEVESDYRVIPLGKSLDARQFMSVLERENGFVQNHEL